MSILVGIDDSAHGRAALDWASREAGLRGVALNIFHAFPWPLAGMAVSGRRLSLWEAAGRLVADAESHARKLAPEVRAELASGGVPASLVERSAAAELVVVGARGHRGFHGLPAGSVASQVAAHASCSVVLVGPEPPHGTHEIVVGVGDDRADPALGAAFAEAALRGVRLRAVHTWLPITALTPATMAPLSSTVGQLERREEHCLIEALAPWRARYPQVEVEGAVISGSPRHILVEASPDAALLVVGAHERSHLLALVLGSVTRAAARHAECPLLVAR
ncbi:MAG: universal stress protein UspA [Actinoallomurus sp.]|jgi:nucleotide-binding universal stress UspA family protein|nr:universal stress protein UspA [Actinoallomurus sp.]